MIPMQYRNTAKPHRLIRKGQLPRPKGEGWDDACNFDFEI
jgi:hypothetical protein